MSACTAMFADVAAVISNVRATMLAVVLVALAASSARAQNRAVFVDVEIHGPSSGVVLDVEPGGTTRIEGALSAGETRHLSVPVPLASESVHIEPRVHLLSATEDLEGSGSARFVAWRGGGSPLATLSPGLRARARPAIAPPTVVVSRAAVGVLVVAFLSVLSLRRRPWWALLVAIVAAAITFPLVRTPARDAEATVTLFDGDVEAAQWRRVDAACDEIVLPDHVDAFELWTDPPAANVTWIVPLDPSRPWRARSAGAQLFVASVFEAGESRVARERNRHAAFDRTWVREEGEWRPHGAWSADAPLPPALADARSGGEPVTTDGADPVGAPPGWLLGLLPQGTPFLVARERASSGRPAGWVRVGGF